MYINMLKGSMSTEPRQMDNTKSRLNSKGNDLQGQIKQHYNTLF